MNLHRLVLAQKPLLALPMILCAALSLAGAARRDNPGNHIWVGDELFRRGKVAEAVFEYEHALRLKPKLKKRLQTRLAAGHFALCEKLVQKKDLTGAFYELKKALDLKRDEGYWHLAQAFLQVKAGDLADARVECRKAMQLEPKDTGLSETCKGLGKKITYFDNQEGPDEQAQIFTDLHPIKDDRKDPVLLHTPRVHYPGRLAEFGYGGIVAVVATVGIDGKSRNERVVKPLGLGLDREALRVVRKMRFKPASRNGTPVSTTVLVEVNFERDRF